MHEALNRNLYLVKEHVGMFKAANNYDVYDPDTGEILLECREDHLGMITKMLRFSDYKRMTPFNIEIRTPSGDQIVRVSRGVSFFLSKVSVFDENDERIDEVVVGPFHAVRVKHQVIAHPDRIETQGFRLLRSLDHLVLVAFGAEVGQQNAIFSSH